MWLEACWGWVWDTLRKIRRPVIRSSFALFACFFEIESRIRRDIFIRWMLKVTHKPCTTVQVQMLDGMVDIQTVAWLSVLIQEDSSAWDAVDALVLFSEVCMYICRLDSFLVLHASSLSKLPTFWVRASMNGVPSLKPCSGTTETNYPCWGFGGLPCMNVIHVYV